MKDNSRNSLVGAALIGVGCGLTAVGHRHGDSGVHKLVAGSDGCKLSREGAKA